MFGSRKYTALLLLFATPLVAAAQAPTNDAVVVAAEYMKSSNDDLKGMAAGELVLDRRVTDLTGKFTTNRPRARANAILRAIGARRIGSKDQEITCADDSPKSCRMKAKAKGVVALSEPRIEGEKASVDVHMWWESGDEETPVATKHLIVDLERVDGAWRVKGNRPLRIS
jgi:hypothetical protein